MIGRSGKLNPWTTRACMGCLLMMLCISTLASAQVPGSLHYQGRLTEPSSGNPVEGETHLAFAIYDTAEDGAFLWSESKVLDLENGLISTLLGDTNPFPADLFDGRELWLGITIGRDTEATPRQPIVPVAYAFFSDNAGHLDGKDSAFYRNASNLKSGTLSTDLYSAYTDLGIEGKLNNNSDDDILLRGQSDLRYWRVGGNDVVMNATLGVKSDHELNIVAGNKRIFRLIPHENSPNIIGGYVGNWVVNGVEGAAIGGGGSEGTINMVTDVYGVVGGGRRNQAGNGTGTVHDAAYATVGGGAFNIAFSRNSTVAGGILNEATAAATTVSGGDTNVAAGDYSTIGGGYKNQTRQTGGVISGGRDNMTNGLYSTVGGGRDNIASLDYSTVSGGYNNLASGVRSAVGGGYDNTADGYESVVGGGVSNMALGVHATVPGGDRNRAEGYFSFAAGRRAKAYHDGAFVWADSTNADFNSDRNKQFKVRAAGGMHLVAQSAGLNPAALRVESTTNNGVGIMATQQSSDATLVMVNTGTGELVKGFSGLSGGNLVYRVENNGAVWAQSFNPTSDQNAKENFEPVDTQAILEKVGQMPITSWNFKNDDPDIRHIGPMAQDFHAAFGVGTDPLSIATVDADGVALAAIQGLYERSRELQDENKALKEELLSVQSRLAALEQALLGLDENIALSADIR